MTKKTLFKRLTKLPSVWFLTGAGAIRRQSELGAECPITALANEHESKNHYRLSHYMKAGKKLKLSRQQTTAITLAADNEKYPKLRNDLLRACHLRD